jgi:hypothetical protein
MCVAVYLCVHTDIYMCVFEEKGRKERKENLLHPIH